jgi:flavoprotein
MNFQLVGLIKLPQECYPIFSLRLCHHLAIRTLVHMNILVCTTCGERYYDRKSMRKIEEIRKKLKNKKLDVEEVGKVMRANAA